jgi:two-component system, cell cycle sensor histidine kinase and response regulator CckA
MPPKRLSIRPERLQRLGFRATVEEHPDDSLPGVIGMICSLESPASALAPPTVHSAVWRDRLRTVMADAGDEDALLAAAVHVLADDFDAPSVRVWSCTATRDELALRATTGLCLPFDGLREHVPVAGTELGRVVALRTSYVAGDLERTAPADVRAWAQRTGIRSFIAVPVVPDQQFWGVLALFTRNLLSADQQSAVEEAARLIGAELARCAAGRPNSDAADLLSSLIHCFPAAVVTLDQTGHVTHWSRAAEELFGWTEAEVLQRPLPIVPSARRLEFVPPDGDARARTIRSRTECQRADLSLIPVERTSAPLYDRTGEIVGRLELFTDETPRRQADRRLQVQAQVARILTGCRTLDEALPLLLAVLGDWLGGDEAEFWQRDDPQARLSRVGVWASDPERQAQRAATAVHLPVDAEDWPARMLRQARIVHEPNLASPLSPGQQALHVLRTGTDAGLAIPILTDAQPLGLLLCRGMLLAPPDEATRQTLGFIADALAQFLLRLRAEAERAQSEAQLRQTQKMDAIGLLAGGVAHDFNNLLTIILAYSELGQGEVDPSDPLHEMFQEIHGAGERAAAMTRKLLSVSRQQPAQSVDCQWNRVITDMERMLQRLLGARFVLELDLTRDPAVVRADVNQLEQVLLNLVVNARDAMPDGGRIVVSTRNVRCSAEETKPHGVPAGPYIELAVRDSGCGMDAPTLARIFEPFFTTKGLGQGTGMGLSTVHGIIQQHRGYLKVESAPGEGTTFFVYLPQLRVQAATEQVDAPCAEIPRGTETILVVEHDDALRALCRKLLEIRGYTVQEAPNGAAALKRVNAPRSGIDLVLSAVELPEMDGTELARQLLGRRSGPKLILMSTSSEPPHGLPPDGLHQFLRKPFTSSDLARQVRRALDG